MKCPFRMEVVKHYAYIPVSEGAEETRLTEVMQEEAYPDCYGCECPFYDYNGFCNRTGEEDQC